MPLCDRVGIRTQDLLLRRQLLYPAELLDLCIPTLLTECIFVAGYRKLDAMFIRSKKNDLDNPHYRYGSAKIQKTISSPKIKNDESARTHSLQLKNICYICTIGRRRRPQSKIQIKTV